MKSKQPITYEKVNAKKSFRFTPFRPKSSQPLADVRLSSEEDLMIMEKSERRYAFILRQLAYHHLAQGNIEGEAYLVSF